MRIVKYILSIKDHRLHSTSIYNIIKAITALTIIFTQTIIFVQRVGANQTKCLDNETKCSFTVEIYGIWWYSIIGIVSGAISMTVIVTQKNVFVFKNMD